MALTPPPFSLFRRKFPLLVTGSLLILGSTPLLAAEQYDCAASSSGGWACTPRTVAKALPRPGEVGTPMQGPEAALVTQTEGRALAVRSADFSHLDWVPRDRLTPAQLAETAPYCSGAYIEPIRPGMDDKTPKGEEPTHVASDVTRYDQEREIVTVAGNVVVRQGSMQVEADEASLHQQDNRADLKGNVKVRDNGSLVVGDSATVQLDTGEATMDNAEFVMHRGQTRGSALNAHREESGIIRLKDGTYTRCEPNSNTWTLVGKDVVLNPDEGFGTGKNVTIRVKDVPVFYTPRIRFPIDDRRQSGFLTPTFRSGGNSSGFTVQAPYYFNLAPNYDATLYPTIMTSRGLLLAGEGRYLTKSSEGQMGAAWLEDQNDKRKNQTGYEKTRWMYNWQHIGGLSSRLLAEVDYTDISDPYYFQDLGNSMGTNRPNYLNQRGTLTWRGDTFNARLNVHALQRTAVADITPYDRLPQLTVDGALPFQPGGMQFNYATEYVYFQRSLKNGDFTNRYDQSQPWYDNNIKGLDRADGQRAHLEPGASLPLNWTWGYLKPSLKYAYTQYALSLDNTGKEYMALHNQNYDNSPNRGLPIASLDGGLYFDRDTNWFGKPIRQTLEPRLYYLYVPYNNQKDIPVFDTGENPFSYGTLWRDNRFSSKDRIGDANQMSFGVTSRWIQANGFERQRISLGEIVYFRDRKVQMPGMDYRNRKDAMSTVSPIAFDYLFRFNHEWRLTADLNWDPELKTTRSGSAMFHYQASDNPNKILNLGYRYRNDTVRYDPTTGTWQYSSDYGTPGSPNYIKDYYKVQQHDMSIIWPIVPQWNAIARWQYDYARNRTLEAFGGFEYDSCCWKLRVINRYWMNYTEYGLNPNLNDRTNNGVFFQIVLKGLGDVMGNRVESFLQQGIEGYTAREEQAH
jgi:LPS-assembly protein